ncbi:hypothetical protein SAMN05216358_2716 [Rhizobium sp. AN5]|uniref:hypothetical protein n=1 Tax=Rhizobium sp. AN5 TaxID=1855304 RepID=UPI000BC4DB88|nr:hypothetical protein [Rhizobium sp. AN5]SOC92560.1 hypothetical protein SAMN05216358_2716 [Rhizobium sp. AN5]
MTYHRPAYEEVRIAHGGNTVALRPTLRAATTLEARFGFPAMFGALDEGNFTIISEIVLAASSPAQDAAAFLAGIPGKPLSSFFDAVQAPLFQLVMMLRPSPMREASKSALTLPGKPVSWPDYYSDLYEKATGWLGWTPDAAWNATPTEIDRAYSGHIAKLKAIHGSGDAKEDKQTDPEQAARNVEAGLDPEFDRAGLQALKAKIGGRA